MPKRSKTQQIKHNEARRSFVKEGKKAIFCLQHIKDKYPDIAKEASNIYDYLVHLYPNKRNLMKTEIYRKQLVNKTTVISQSQNTTVISQSQNTTVQSTTEVNNQSKELQPVLTIPLMKAPLRVEDIMPQAPILNEEQTDRLLQQSFDMIRDLQEDPDLKCFFTDEPANHVTLTSLAGISPMTLDQEIDEIIRTEFDQLGSDLPDIVCEEEEDELSRLACM